MWRSTISSDELYHSGTKGMKWHNRLYQYEDGSLTPLGRIHYGIGEARKKKNQKKALEKARQARVAKKKDADERKRLVERGTQDEVLRNRHKLSSEEMNKALDRLKQEDIVNQRIKELNPNYKRIEQFNHYANQAKKLVNGTQQFIDAYNTGAGIYNAVMVIHGNDKRLPKINYSNQNGPSDVKPNNQNNSNNGNKNKSPQVLQAVIKRANEINQQDKKQKN